MASNNDPWNTKWQRVSRLSRGGQGETWRVRPIAEPDDPGKYVLKVLHNQRSRERRNRMYTEVASLRIVECEGVSKYVDSNADKFKTDEALYLVTQYIPGPTLGDPMVRLPVPLGDALLVCGRVLTTLALCHKAGVVHRDIKPSNVILRDGRCEDAVLIDFGLAFNEERAEHAFETAPDQHMGNRFIQLPEYHARDSGKRDAISDVSQVCGLFLYLLTGFEPAVLADDQNRLPHRRPSAMAPLQRLSPSHQKSLNRIFDVGFQHDKSRRWQSAALLLEELMKLDASGSAPADLSFVDRLAALQEESRKAPDRLRARALAEAFHVFHPTIDRLIPVMNEKLEGQVSLSIANRRLDAGKVEEVVLHVTDAALKKHLWNRGLELVARDNLLDLGIRGAPEFKPMATIGLYDPHRDDLLRRAIEEALIVCAREGLAHTP